MVTPYAFASAHVSSLKQWFANLLLHKVQTSITIIVTFTKYCIDLSFEKPIFQYIAFAVVVVFNILHLIFLGAGDKMVIGFKGLKG